MTTTHPLTTFDAMLHLGKPLRSCSEAERDAIATARLRMVRTIPAKQLAAYLTIASDQLGAAIEQARRCGCDVIAPHAEHRPGLDLTRARVNHHCRTI